MFNREEASRIRQEFWKAFGRYMNPVPSAEGIRINWINYHTSVKDVFFRMEANQNSAMISISMEHKSAELRDLCFQQFLEFKTLLQNELDEEWEWETNVHLEVDKIINRISKEISDVTVFNKDHWPELISFFKPRIIALDHFWENARYSFDSIK